MKTSKTILWIISLLSFNITAQTVTGRLINQFGAGIPNAELKLYIYPRVYDASSSLDGSFTFTDINSVIDEELPEDYFVSNNYPNPFNPETRIILNLPIASRVKVSVYNILGQMVLYKNEEILGAGNNYVDLKLDGLSNGIYLARITIDDKYTVMRKLTLLYGSQHLSHALGNYGAMQNKSVSNNSSVVIDSLVVTGSNVVKAVFTNLPPITEGSIDLGDLSVAIPCPGTPTVNYAGKIYNTVKIGEQCWLRENLDVGTMIQVTEEMTDNGIIEKYCYDNDPNNCNTYGGLYQWNETMQYSTTPSTQGICPSGWHIPTLAEFQTLASTVNFDGNALKAIGQEFDDGAGTNTSGFSALLAGCRYYDYYDNGNFHFFALGGVAFFWNSTLLQYHTDITYVFYLECTSKDFDVMSEGTYEGFSIRCLMDYLFRNFT